MLAAMNRNRLWLFALAGMLFAGGARGAEKSKEGNFQKDREAILKMAGDFRVSFYFKETLSLSPDYKVQEKAYATDAFETVKVVEDGGKRIVLQHLLQAGGQVVKHWAQTWTYEDPRVLSFEGDRTWVTKTLSATEVAGTWTQSVTEVTDEPRYEGKGKWIHLEGGASEWTSNGTNRPLPRREYTKRDDYDLLLVVNRHTVTADGWYHEQDNVKQVKRDGKSYPLCREVGLNRYERVKDHDFSAANTYWEKTSGFWKDVRGIWTDATDKSSEVKLKDTVDGKALYSVLKDYSDKVEKGDGYDRTVLAASVKSFVEPGARAK